MSQVRDNNDRDCEKNILIIFVHDAKDEVASQTNIYVCSTIS